MQIDSVHFTPWASLAGGMLLGLAASLFILINGRLILGSLLFGAGWGLAGMALFELAESRRQRRARSTMQNANPGVGVRNRQLNADIFWLRGQDLNLRPLGYEPNELPDCSTPRLFL